MDLEYIGPHDAVDVDGVTVTKGSPIRVKTALGKRLLEQPSNWQIAKKKES